MQEPKQILRTIKDTTHYALILLENAKDQCSDGLDGKDYSFFTISDKLLQAEEEIAVLIRRINELAVEKLDGQP